GLDPNQLADIRGLIKQLGKEKTVIFSTHIMQEVKAICDRVLIINKGRIVANDTIGQLQQRISSESAVTVEFLGKVAVDALKKVPEVKNVQALGDNRYQLTADSRVDLRPALFDFAVEKGVKLLEMNKEVYDIDEVFHRLTR
ncbi:MAG: gliding motility-associated ABC transporter ATP-binding subunit GldA, partial [Phaeodactylibacter sp.]|nr:gliding motility-associated ABC transporter ATP-binding subunit GldA [Phaeodactylibacter sp.]